MPRSGPIILVEDDIDDQELIMEIIQGTAIGNPLKLFHNGQQALEYLRASPDYPFLIICDVNMPVMNGLELRQHMHDNESIKNRSAPFIFLSTTEDREVVRRAFALSVQGFFKKPAGFHELQQLLELMLDYWKHCEYPGK
ncbi:MAG TPA: response regulator [Puia sp.]|nr:response regulator [Puia sp.]